MDRLKDIGNAVYDRYGKRIFNLYKILVGFMFVSIGLTALLAVGSVIEYALFGSSMAYGIVGILSVVCVACTMLVFSLIGELLLE